MSDADGPAGAPLASFHPLVREWFLSRFGAPTPVQAEAWPAIASGSHVLALAPTGSGKTLTAFLGAISRIATGELLSDAVSVLYVSPLKALGEDVRRNLEAPLAGIAALFRERGQAFPAARVAVRNGDTTQAERRRMLRDQPAILVTTPESLALMLDSPRARDLLSTVRLLILDEVHALAGDKRGAMLACSVGRLALLAGEFQRLALSATARPPEAIAAFVGGRQLVRSAPGGPSGGPPGGPEDRAEYRERAVRIVSPPAAKRIELSVEWPERSVPGPASRPSGLPEDSARYGAITEAIVGRLRAAGGIIVFADSRRRAERLAFLVNESAGEGSAWAHHGSLSREARRVVEERFKGGEIGCIVATASLELGIDVGGIAEAILAGSPWSVASALQRLGRAGHGVGETSRGALYPFHGMDLVLAAAVARGVEERAVEETLPVSCPLDVLAQVLLELAAEGPRTCDALYDIVRSFPPFAALPRGLFDSTLEMLAGRYAGTRVRELEPRITLDRASGMVEARDGTRALLYSSGGTIPDRGLYSLRARGSRTRIGELDEEFVFERKVGEAFTLGAQTWRITAIGDEAVEVVPAGPDPDIVPFWKGDALFRSPEICSRSLALLDALDELDEEGGAELLARSYGFGEAAARACSRFVAAQKAAGSGRASLPRTARLVLEVNADPSRKGDTVRLVLHTLRGLAVNEVLAQCLAAAWEAATGLPVRSVADDDRVLILAPALGDRDPAADARGLLAGLSEGGRIDRLLRSRLEGTGLFGAEFRKNAGRSLLLPRGSPGKRLPLWTTRLRAKKLFDAVKSFPDFPAIVETWRACLADLLDPAGALDLARGVAEGRIELSCFESRVPSPLAREALWKETGEFMYSGDALEARAVSSVSDRIVAEAVRSARLRPRLDPALVADFSSRLKRLVDGWGPEDPKALAEWAKERVLIPESELPLILECGPPSLREALAADPDCGGRLRRLLLPGASERALVHAERERELSADPASFVAEWMRREGPVAPSRITSLFGLAEPELGALLGRLEDDGVLVLDLLVGDGGPETVIDAQNLEILLRRSRAASRPKVEPRPPEALAALAAALQGLGRAPAREGRTGAVPGPGRLGEALERLAGASAPVELWETEILPARLEEYSPEGLDALLASSPWLWFGRGKGACAFSRVEDLELWLHAGGASSRIVPGGPARMDYWEMKERSGLASADAARAIWDEAWRGLVASDSFRSLREGLANGFGEDLPDMADGGPEPLPFGTRRRLPRALRERWRAGAPVAGFWYALDLGGEDGGEGEPDALDGESLDAARVRALAARWGLLCRSIFERERAPLRWSDLFPAMRRLELAGELLSGRFFEGVDGPQFLSPSALPLLPALGEGGGSPFWVNALDPAAAACYAARAGADGASAAPRPGPALPPRVAANRICLDGGRVVAVSSRTYRKLELEPGPDDPRIPAILSLFAIARSRRVAPVSRIALESVNGTAAARSPYAEALRALGFEEDRGKMVLW